MTDLNRRQFVTRTLGGAGALARGAGLLNAEDSPPPKKRATDLVPLGKTGLKVSRFGLGSGTNGWEHESNQTRAGIDSFVKLVRHAYEREVNFFDAADMYGTHAYIHRVRINHAGAVMDGKPDEVVPIIRKMHDAGRGICGMKINGAGQLKGQLGESLRFVLGLGCVDTMTIGFEKPEEIDDFISRMDRVLAG